MSGGNGCLELKIIIRYEGLKATQYFSKYTQRSDVVLRDDLLTLKLPHPKRENTTFISHGCVECVWPLVPKNGILHKQMITKTSPRNAAEQEAWKEILGKLSISNVAVKEIYPEAGKGRKNLKRPNPFTGERVQEGSSSRLPSSQENGYQVPPPITGTRSARAAEAEAFLEDMRYSFRPRKIIKVEPVDVPLPPAAPRSLSSHLSSTSKPTNPPESVSSSSSLVSAKPLRAKVLPPPAGPAHANHMLPPKPATTPISEAKPTSLPAPIQEMLRELQPLLSKPQPLPAEPAQRQSIVPDKNKKTPPIPTQPKAFEVTSTSSSTISRPDVSDIPEIQRLTRESCDIRRQINADSVRDASIISKLKQLNASYIPGPLKSGTPDSIMEGRIKKLEQDLDAERRMRLEAEDVVRDIRRECKAPFIVPSLLDAFVKLSRLTTKATRLNGTVAKDDG